MTLNITAVSRERVYQLGDFMLTDVRTRKPRPFVAQKSVVVQRIGWTALVTFSGVGSVGSTDVADWLADAVLALPGDVSFPDLLGVLQTADTWLGTVPMPVRRHTFSVAGFIGTKPVVALVSNWENLGKKPAVRAGNRLEISQVRPSGTRVFVAGSGAANVSKVAVARIIGAIRADQEPAQVAQMMAEINEDVSRINRTVSAGCFVSWSASDGSGGAVPYNVPEHETYMPKFALPGLKLEPKIGPDGKPMPMRLVQMGMQRSEPTRRHHEEQLRLKPDDASVWNNFGAYLMDKEDDEEGAVRVYLRALEIDPAEANAAGNLANIKSAHGELDEAERLYKIALVSNPRNAIQRRNYATFLAIKRADIEAAKRLYGEGLVLDQENKMLLDGMAALPSRERCEEAIRARPDDPELHNSLGVCLSTYAKDNVGAEAEYRRAVELNPKQANALTNLAILLWQERQDTEQAKELFRDAVEADPSSVVIRNNYAEFLADVIGDSKGAREVYERGLELNATSETLLAGLARLGDRGSKTHAASAD